MADVFGNRLCGFVSGFGNSGKKAQEISAKKSLLLFSTYAAIACLFGGWIHWYFGEEMASEFFMGYIVEMGLSIDNVFVISLVFPIWRFRVLCNTAFYSGGF